LNKSKTDKKSMSRFFCFWGLREYHFVDIIPPYHMPDFLNFCNNYPESPNKFELEGKRDVSTFSFDFFDISLNCNNCNLFNYFCCPLHLLTTEWFSFQFCTSQESENGNFDAQKTPKYVKYQKLKRNICFQTPKMKNALEQNLKTYFTFLNFYFLQYRP
jgi:hypothetical protein